MHPNSLKALQENRAKGWFGRGKHKLCERANCQGPAVSGRRFCRKHGGKGGRGNKTNKSTYRRQRDALFASRRALQAELDNAGARQFAETARFGDALLDRAAEHFSASLPYPEFKRKLEYLETLKR